MKLIALALTAFPAFASAQTWVDYMNHNPQPVQQEQPQPTYSQQYNAGYMDGYLRAHGFQANSDRSGYAYDSGYDDARRAERR